MAFTISYQIGSSDPVSVAFDLTNAAAPGVLRQFAQYQGLDTDGMSTAQVQEALIKGHGKAIAEGARQVYIETRRATSEGEIMAAADEDSPLFEAVEE